MQSNLLKAARIKAELKQTEVASALDIDVTSYSKRENGVIQFKANEISKLKEILSLNPQAIDEIFFTNKVETNSTNSA